MKDAAILDRLERAIRKRVRLEDYLQHVANKRDSAERDRAQLQRRLARWEFPAELRALLFRADVPPEEVLDAIRQHVKLSAHADDEHRQENRP